MAIQSAARRAGTAFEDSSARRQGHPVVGLLFVLFLTLLSPLLFDALTPYVTH